MNGLLLSIRDRVNLFHPDWSKASGGARDEPRNKRPSAAPKRMNKGRRRRSMFQISRRTCSEWPKTSCKMRQRKAKAMTGALSVRPVETAWPTASNKGRSVSYIFEKDNHRPTASITQRGRHSRPHTRRKRIKAPEAFSQKKGAGNLRHNPGARDRTQKREPGGARS